MLVLSDIESGLNASGNDTCMDDNGCVVVSHGSDEVTTSCVIGLD